MKTPGIKLLGIKLLAAVFGMTVLSLSTMGQEERQAPEAPPPEAETETEPQAPRGPNSAGADEVFIPSEELSADEEVTFPVDI